MANKATSRVADGRSRTPVSASPNDDDKPCMNSFFAGIGGFDIAFERSGFRTVFQCEINDFCNQILRMHWPDVKRATDIQGVDASSIPDADVWCGGFPCQDVSVARGSSERKGLKGARSGLFFSYAELIEARKPRAVIIENVAGLFNSNGGRDFGVILQRMTSMGYAVAWRLLNSRYFGVPQSRPRVYLCCWRDDARRALSVMFDERGAYKPEGGTRRDFITEAPGTKGYPKVPVVSYCLAATSGRHTGTDWSRTYVVCSDGVRRMTPLEYERLQGFPDNWTRPVDSVKLSVDDMDTLRYQAVGNAVSVPVVEWLARRVRDNISLGSGEALDEGEALAYVPGFRPGKMPPEELTGTDFTDDSVKYSWPHAGLAWNGGFVGGSVQPTPHAPIESKLIDVVEKNETSDRYYLTPNAARGILRRVDNQGRTLFPPLRAALEKEAAKKENTDEQ